MRKNVNQETNFFFYTSKTKIVSALEPSQTVGLLQEFSLAFDNSKNRLKKGGLKNFKITKKSTKGRLF